MLANCLTTKLGSCRVRTLGAQIFTVLLCSAGCSSENDSEKNVDHPPLLDRYVLSSPDSVPEGVAFDQKTRAFYATSINGASITRIDDRGAESFFREPDNSAILVGVKIDADRRRLWVCALNVGNTDNQVWVFDVDDGEELLKFELGAITTNGSCNDLALDSSGNAYVTDPANPYVYFLDANTGEGEIFASDSLFVDATSLGFGLNGIVVIPDDSGLLVGKFAPPALFHVSLTDAKITTIQLSGDALPAPDGLMLLDEKLYSVSDRAVTRLLLNAEFSRAQVKSVAQISGLTTGTVAEEALYVIKSEGIPFALGQPLELPFEIFRVALAGFD